MSNYKIEDNKIIFNALNVVTFEFPIKQSILYNNTILVVLYKLDDKLYNQNVFAVDFNGEIIWQIEKSEELDLIGNCPFANIQIIDFEIIVYNWCGFRCKINPETGQIINMIFTK